MLTVCPHCIKEIYIKLISYNFFEKKLTQNQYFHYDGIIFLDESVSNYFEELNILRLSNSKYLIVLLDDRNYSLKEKNIIIMKKVNNYLLEKITIKF